MTRDEEDSISDISHRKKNVFSWSSISSTYSQITLLSSHTEDIDTIWTYLMLQGYFLLDTDQKRREKLFELLCRLASQGNLIFIQQLAMDERTSRLVQLDSVDNENQWTPLMYACCFGRLTVARYLLDMGAKVDAQDHIGWTPLMWAVTNDHCDIVETLLEYNASVDTKSFNGTSVYDLINIENERMMRMLPTVKIPVSSFIWDQCLPDQMFVFTEEQLDSILTIAITEFQLPIKSRSEIYVPASIIFLCARYAHYYVTKDLVHALLTNSVNRIQHVIDSKRQDVHTLAFWISNLTQLLYYLKRDTQVVIETAKYQVDISELVSEAYTCLIHDSEKRLEHIFESAILEYEQLDGLEMVHFADDWQRFFRRSSTVSRQSISELTCSPKAVTNLLSSILYVLQSYEVHPAIIIQAFGQLFHFLSCELFNRILSHRRHLCRSRAIQIRMNITVMEEWIRDRDLPLETYLTSVIQLVQLLQCVSQSRDLMEFIHKIKSFDQLNPMQIKRIILNYRYEVNEPRLPEEIEKYTMQIAEDTLRQRQSVELPPSRRASASSLGSLFGQRKHTAIHYTEEEQLSEFKDSKYMLPFSLPTTNHMLQTSCSEQLKQKTRTERENGAWLPNIPEDWLIKLNNEDKK
ncbi:hypothetical protein RMATCC62417_14487 [Rhizopus microsporus]|nr:hypothetical protein RMATCC62417_14487 [Rhizopus microsporus]